MVPLLHKAHVSICLSSSRRCRCLQQKRLKSLCRTGDRGAIRPLER